MPTLNPRVNVTLSPSLHQLVSDLAHSQRVSKATVLRELLEASEPMLAQAVAMMRAAQELQDEAKGKFAADMKASLASVERKAARAMQLAAGITSDLVAEAEAIRGRRPGRAGAAVPTRPGKGGAGTKRTRTPLPSKRGVKS